MKKLTIFIVLLFIALNVYFMYYSKKKPTVLLVGEVFGFDVNEQIENKKESNLYIATSYGKVGIMTFVSKDTNQFYALGHCLSNKKIQNDFKGNCYQANVKGIEKSTEDSVGRIKAEIDKTEKIGVVCDNSDLGVFGILDRTLDGNYCEIETASRFDIQKGKAEIWADIDGKGLKSYIIEIISVNYFHKNRNIIFKVNSQDLLEKAGGILQGMSGAPVVQNGKLIGAVNYASSESLDEACAIFVDKLI